MKLSNFLEHLSRLDNIHQWEERDSIIKESVSQHSFKVSAIAHYLLRIIEKEMKELLNNDLTAHLKFVEFKANCLSYAILHDFDEAIIGRDISHVVKYNSYNGEKIREAINDFVNHQETLDFQGLISKPTEAVKKFVKVCDWIALNTFCKRNIRMGCISFASEEHYCDEKLREAISSFVKIFSIEFNTEFFNMFETLDKIVTLKWQH